MSTPIRQSLFPAGRTPGMRRPGRSPSPGTGHGHLYHGLGVRPLTRWFGPARVGFLWKRGAYVPPVQRALAEAVRVSLADAAGAG